MIGIQTKLGKAFEYSNLLSLYKFLSLKQEIEIIENSSYKIAKKNFNEQNSEVQENMLKASNAAIKAIFKLEPQLEYGDVNSPLFLSIQEDSAGKVGDVRDILSLRKQNGWEIGFSCKHNHIAVKHSRLSSTIDFGLSWFGVPCSENYFDEINVIFDELKVLKEQKIAWKNLVKKEERFYITVLDAFMRELIGLYESNKDIPHKLVSYLLGKNDFYKIITHETRKVTQIQAFNIYGTLSKTTQQAKPEQKIKQLKLPTTFYNIDYKKGSKNTIILVCDAGWTISMRIHSASTIVEPSLKFDIRLTGVPENLYTQYESWK
ncbi:MAG: HaeIII family restriction endonuclease [Sebaldella sp.]|nr:HaeIII family restriction endonuclease [Sebaldella sp.]